MTQPMDTAPRSAPTSPFLAETLQRAVVYAEEQSHKLVSAEHLLLALTEDADAIFAFQRRNVDLDQLRDEIASIVSRNEDRFGYRDSGQPVYGADLLRVLHTANGAASPRRPVDGGLVLAAIIADGRTPAAELVRGYGLTFEEVSRAVRPMPGPASPPLHPPLDALRSTAREAALGLRRRPVPQVNRASNGYAQQSPPAYPPEAAWVPPAEPDHGYNGTAAPYRPPEGYGIRAYGTDQGWQNGQAPQWEQVPVAPARDAVPPTARRRARGGNTRRQLARTIRENIPRKLQLGRPVQDEVQMPRPYAEGLLHNLDGSSPEQQPLAAAIVVRLRGEAGAFTIEAATPEVHWIGGEALLDDDPLSWRWTLTGKQRGRAQLQLIASIRGVAHIGLMSETALPGQNIDVTIMADHTAGLVRWALWIFGGVALVLLGVVLEHVLHLWSHLAGR